MASREFCSHHEFLCILFFAILQTPKCAAKSKKCKLQPDLEELSSMTWQAMLTGHAGGFDRVLVMCAPQSILKMKSLHHFQGGDLDVDRLRNARGVQSVKMAAKYAHHTGACILLLAAEVCQQFAPAYVPANSNIKVFPSIIVFRYESGAQWVPYQRPSMEVRRMNGCGLHGECILLDLAEMARASGDPKWPKWSSLSTPWPGTRRIQPASPTFTKTLPSFELQSRWTPKADSPRVSACLLSFLDEVVRFKPAWNDMEDAVTPSALATLGDARSAGDFPTLILHFSGLEKRKGRMLERLKASELEMQTFFVEMTPDYVNDTMRICLGPQRQKTMDSMSDNPDWRLPTRGEDSLAAKHLSAAVWLIKSGTPYVLVLEDDVWFSQHMKVDVAEFLREISAVDWDVAAIGTCYHHRTPFGHRILPHAWLTQIMPCAHAYLLSQKGAHAILNSLPLQLPIDLQINLIAQKNTPLDDLRRARELPGRPQAEIYWSDPPFAFQWPEDTTRSVERD